jgi:flavin reductase (DIM6/NTAB) family NADH-FMN oxidoreductase RutF
MLFDPAALSTESRYKLLIGTIVPRPIAWVSTINPAGQLNLAPFSFFNGVSSTPMILAFAPANKPDGSEKDTLRNAKPASEGGTGECVINLVPEHLARAMSACAEPLPHGQSEFDLARLTPAPSTRVRPPRVAEALVAFECRTREVIRFAPNTPSGGNLILAEVLAIQAADGLIDDRFHVDADRLAAIGRMGGPTYCRTRERFTMPMGQAALTMPDPLA